MLQADCRLSNTCDVTACSPPKLLAGAFCTNQYMVGTGAFIRPQINGLNNPESGTYAQFWVSALT